MPEKEPEVRKPANVIEAIAAVMSELPSIGKDEGGQGSNVGYKYRGIEQITGHIQTLCGKYGVVFVPKVLEREVREITINSKPWTEDHLVVEYRVYGPGGVEWDEVSLDAQDGGQKVEMITRGDYIVVGPIHSLGRDNSDKGVNKCMTQAFKYALLQVFMIGDRNDDADGEEAHEADEKQPLPDIFVKAGWANQGDYDEVRRLTRLELKRWIDVGDISEEDARIWWDEWKSVTPRSKASHQEMWERLRAPLAPVIGQRSQEPAPEASEAPEATQAPLSEPPEVQRYPMSASELVAAGVTDPELVDALEAVEKMSPSQITKGLKDRALPHEGSSTERHSRLGFAMAYEAHMEPKLSALPAPAATGERED
jgi:hypothetical protein